MAGTEFPPRYTLSPVRALLADIPWTTTGSKAPPAELVFELRLEAALRWLLRSARSWRRCPAVLSHRKEM